MTKIAIFPIPGCVTFPHTVFPLHVFEPRYRQMVSDCLRDNRLMAICDVQKEIKPAKKNQALDEALKSNQATYKPEYIFSAGECELIRTLDDGRIHLKVNVQKRYKFVNEVQTLPYVIAQCEELMDRPIEEASLIEAKQYQEKIVARLRILTSYIQELNTVLSRDDWLSKDPVEFSFAIFGLVRLDPSYAQKILEMRSPVERLSFFLECLNSPDI